MPDTLLDAGDTEVDKIDRNSGLQGTHMLVSGSGRHTLYKQTTNNNNKNLLNKSIPDNERCYEKYKALHIVGTR